MDVGWWLSSLGEVLCQVKMSQLWVSDETALTLKPSSPTTKSSGFHGGGWDPGLGCLRDPVSTEPPSSEIQTYCSQSLLSL